MTHENAPKKPAMADYSGLDALRAMIAGHLKPPPIAVLMEIELVAVEFGKAVFEGVPTTSHCNPMGSVHGGWYGSILDSALGCAVLSELDAGVAYTTLEYKVNITRAIPVGMQVRATATTSHVGRSTGVADARVIGVKDGKTYATGSTTCIVLR